MKKKLYSALAITLLAVALLIFVSRGASDAIVKDTEMISQESDTEHPQDTESVLMGGLEDVKEESKGDNKGTSNNGKSEVIEESDDVMDYEEPSSGTTVNMLLGNDLSHDLIQG